MSKNVKTPLLLVALPKLYDPNFFKSVVLLVEHDENGALGFIINRPSAYPVKTIIENQKYDIPHSVAAWVGGPVGTHSGLVLHGKKDLAPDKLDLDSIALSSSEGALEELATYGKLFESIPANERKDRIPILYPYRFIVGHAGWGAQQLESEIRQGAWMEVPLNLDLIFNTPWENLWDQCLSHVGVDPSSLVDSNSAYLH